MTVSKFAAGMLATEGLAIARAAVVAAFGLAAVAGVAQAQSVQGEVASEEEQALVEKHRERMVELARTELIEWVRDPVIIDAVREQNIRNGEMSMDEILRLDTVWRDQTKKREKPMIWDLLDRLHSILLRDRRELSEGLVTEIIVMDQYGLNAAISDGTSDYYQGDEEKYQDTYLIGPDAVHVSELYLDESTQTMQTQVSMTVTDPETGDPIGAVTFGIDLSKLE